MGFMDNLRGLGRSLFDDVEKTLGRVTSHASFTRVVQAAYLIAMADGSISNEEKGVLQKVLARKFPHFKTVDIVKAIDEAAGELAFTVEGGTQVLLTSIAKAAGTDEAPLIMVAVLAVANADGDFDDKERAVAKTIAGRLGLTPQDYAL